MSININLIPIGNSYWVTATKVGSIYLNNFSNSESGYLRLSFSEYNPQHELEKDMLICELPNGFIGNITIHDFNHNIITNQYTQNDIIDILNKVSVIVIRNPKDRFFSGMIHKLTEFFIEIQTAYTNNTLNDVQYHSGFRFDLTKYPIDYKILTTPIDSVNTPANFNDEWSKEWERFNDYFLNDLFLKSGIDDIILSDLHTQPVFYLAYLLLHQFKNWQSIKVIDINDIDSHPAIFIDELGVEEYTNRYNSFHNSNQWNIRQDGIDRTNIIKRVSNKRFYFYSNMIERYFETSRIFLYEKLIFNILNKKNINYEKTINKNIIQTLDNISE
jgi:hypothetical protein